MIRELIASQDDSFQKVSLQFANAMAIASNNVKTREISLQKFTDAPEDEPYVPVSARVKGWNSHSPGSSTAWQEFIHDMNAFGILK